MRQFFTLDATCLFDKESSIPCNVISWLRAIFPITGSDVSLLNALQQVAVRYFTKQFV